MKFYLVKNPTSDQIATSVQGSNSLLSNEILNYENGTDFYRVLTPIDYDNSTSFWENEYYAWDNIAARNILDTKHFDEDSDLEFFKIYFYLQPTLSKF